VALDSRARTRFQASYIDRIEKDTLSPNVKGTAIWRTDPARQTEGYYVFSPKLNEYRAIHYIEEDRLWAFVACDEQNKWYTIKPVPKTLGLGPTLTPIQAIDVDPPEDTSTTKPLTPTTTTVPTLATVTQPTMSQAGYDLNQRVTLDLFQNGLPNNLVWNCVKFDHPYDWNTWTNSARQQHEEYIQLSNRLKGNKVMGGSCEQWTNALTRRRDPNAMDVGRARARATMTEDEKSKRIKEGKCFRCDQKGHISRFCPQKRIAQASSTPSSSNNATVATATITSNNALSADQKAEIFLTQLYNESDEVRARFANIMFDKKEDFPHA